MLDNNVPNNRGFRREIVIIDKCSKLTWCIPLKIKGIETTTDDSSEVFITSKRKINQMRVIEELILFYKFF